MRIIQRADAASRTLIVPTGAFSCSLAYIHPAERRMRRISGRLGFPLSLELHEAGMRHAGACPTHMGQRIPIMITGTVKFFNADKGYGFIAPEDGSGDAFVHISAVERAGMRTLDKEQRISYELETDRRGKTSAANLQPA
jgi:cold shock protein